MWEVKDDRFKLIKIKKEYTDFLRNHIDNKIPYEHEGDKNLSRPFIGIMISHDNINYVIPLTSPKTKHIKMHNSIDFHKIAGGLYGAINFNNMFPVLNDIDICEEINTDLTNVTESSEIQYVQLLRNQLSWINKGANRLIIIQKAQELYESYCSGTLNNSVKQRCCNFKELERYYTDFFNK